MLYIEMYRRWTRRVEKWLMKRCRRQILFFEESMSGKLAILKVTIEDRELHIDLYAICQPQPGTPLAADPMGDYFEWADDVTGDIVGFNLCRSAFELIHQRAVTGPIGRLNHRLSWWESRWLRPPSKRSR